MITRHYKNLLAMVAESATSLYCGSLPVRAVTGKVYYLTSSPMASNASFPNQRASTPSLYTTGAGISVGTGSTPASELDYNLENTITSGISMSVSNTAVGVYTQNGLPYPYIQYNITITNTGNDAITIREIGYKQNFFRAVDRPGIANSTSDVVCLIDRTVLSNPLTIEAGDAGIIEYTIGTKPFASKTIGGVEIVSFTYGTDAQIGAMIDAAHNGTIDLQTDGGWQVGDIRTITVGAFDGGTSFAEQTVSIAISSFEDYNSCGCVMQFDFVEELDPKYSMSASNTNSGGYGSTRMYSTTLPALANALPSWLKTRLRTFSVLASAGSRSSTIETIGNNKLALRSTIEILGTLGNSFAGEGELIEYYQPSVNRAKKLGYNGTTTAWLTRSPATGSNSNFCSITTGGANSTSGATTALGISPFGCV